LATIHHIPVTHDQRSFATALWDCPQCGWSRPAPERRSLHGPDLLDVVRTLNLRAAANADAEQATRERTEALAHEAERRVDALLGEDQGRSPPPLD
jgi:hypothetical protein